MPICVDDRTEEALTVPERGDAASLLRCGERALHVYGDLRAGRGWFDAAYRAAEAAGDRGAMAQAAVGLGGLWVHEQRGTAEAALLARRVEEALAGLPAGSALALRLRVRLAAEADYVAGTHEATMGLLAEAQRIGDPVASVEAASLAHHCVLGPDHAQLRHALAATLVRDGVRTGRPGDVLMGLLWRTVDLFLDGDPRAERSLAELRAALAAQSHLAIGYVLSAIDVMRAIRAGRLDHAESRAAVCAKQGRLAGDIDATGWYGAQLTAIRWYQGRIGELVPVLSDLANSPSLSAVDHSYQGALAVAAAVAVDHRQAAGALARLGAGGLARLPRSSSWFVTMYGAVEAAYLLGDRGIAAQAYELLVPFADRPMLASLGAACFGSVQQALGIAALTLDAPDRAVAHLRAAVQDNLAIGHWPATVLSRTRLAQALALRAGATDVGEAHRERDLAELDAAGLGMRLPALLSSTKDGPAVCRRRGQQWEITLGRRTAVVGRSRGMQYLAVLIANPGHEISAVELAAGPSAAAAQLGAEGLADAGTSRQPVLDEVAKREYRNRLAKLQQEIEAYEAKYDHKRAEGLRTERDWLLAELSVAAGLGGRTRAFTSNEERARIAVGKAIRRALRYIAEIDATIGKELSAAIHTGTRCSYQP